MQKIHCNDMDFFPYDLMFTTHPKIENQRIKQFETMLIDNNVIGNLRWGDFRKFNSALSHVVEGIYRQIIEGGQRYTKSGAYPPHLKIASERKKGIKTEVPTIPREPKKVKNQSAEKIIPTENGPSEKNIAEQTGDLFNSIETPPIHDEPKKEKKMDTEEKISMEQLPDEKDSAKQTDDLLKNIERQPIPGEIEKENLLSQEKTPEEKVKKKKDTAKRIKDILKIPVEDMSIQQLNLIILRSDLTPKALTPYIERQRELQKKPVNYNRPPHIKTAKSLITKVFSGKANPSIWTKSEYDKIMKSKLYSIKMGIEHLKEFDPNGLNDVLEEYQPKIDALLKKLNYNSIDEIKF